MWGYEQFVESRPRNNGVKTTLTEANMTGDFSALLGLSSAYQIYNPLTRRVSGNQRGRGVPPQRYALLCHYPESDHGRAFPQVWV